MFGGTSVLKGDFACFWLQLHRGLERLQKLEWFSSPINRKLTSMESRHSFPSDGPLSLSTTGRGGRCRLAGVWQADWAFIPYPWYQISVPSTSSVFVSTSWTFGRTSSASYCTSWTKNLTSHSFSAASGTFVQLVTTETLLVTLCAALVAPKSPLVGFLPH